MPKTIEIFEKIDGLLTAIDYELSATHEYINLTPKNDKKMAAIFYWSNTLRLKIQETVQTYLGCQMIRLWRQLLHTTLPEALSEEQDQLRLKLNEKLSSIKGYTRKLEKEEKNLEDEYEKILLAKSHIEAAYFSHSQMQHAQIIIEPHMSLRARGISEKLGRVGKPISSEKLNEIQKSVYRFKTPEKLEQRMSLFERVRKQS